jgi:hypothetical protein
MLKKNLKSAISALFGALLIVGLVGCSASGPNAETRNIRQVTDGVEGTSGAIKALNVLLVTQEDGSAVLVGTFVNTSEDRDAITAITANKLFIYSLIIYRLIDLNIYDFIFSLLRKLFNKIQFIIKNNRGAVYKKKLAYIFFELNSNNISLIIIIVIP